MADTSNAITTDFALTDLASSFENAATSSSDSSSRKKKGPPSQRKADEHTSLPTPLMIYQAGAVLYETREQSVHGGPTVMDAYRSLTTMYRDMIESLPRKYLSEVVLKEINGAFVAVCHDDDGTTGNGETPSSEAEVVAAVRSMCGLYTHSQVACVSGFSGDVCVSLTMCYDKLTDGTIRTAILETLSCLLLDGLILRYRAKNSKVDSNEDDSGLRHVMEVVQNLLADGKNTCLGDLQEWQESRQGERHGEKGAQTLVVAAKSTFAENPQREYLILMLTSSPRLSIQKAQAASSTANPQTKPKNGNNNNKKKTKASTGKKQTAMQHLTKQVRDVLPHLGDGYIETALACYNGDASRTITALLEAQSDSTKLHPRLRALDQSLPARRQESSSRYENDDDEARRIAKSHARAVEKQEENEAYMLSVMGEYNDDYDDQYDGMGEDGGAAGEIGGADGGMYDVDLEAVRAYNKMAREAEKESGFWEENRNLNREQGKGRKNKAAVSASTDNGDNSDNSDGGDGDGERKYRGPDKGKGGRIIGPDGKYVPFKKGGKKGKQPQQQQQQQQQHGGGGSAGQPGKKKGGGGGGGGGGGQSKAGSGGGPSDGMSKIQKRRKNDNKAKVANHHRKERAQKKAAGGM